MVQGLGFRYVMALAQEGLFVDISGPRLILLEYPYIQGHAGKHLSIWPTGVLGGNTGITVPSVPNPKAQTSTSTVVEIVSLPSPPGLQDCRGVQKMRRFLKPLLLLRTGYSRFSGSIVVPFHLGLRATYLNLHEDSAASIMLEVVVQFPCRTIEKYIECVTGQNL